MHSISLKPPISLLGTQLLIVLQIGITLCFIMAAISAWENKLFEKSLSIHTDVDNDDSVFFVWTFT